jgi:hypothetical protein
MIASHALCCPQELYEILNDYSVSVRASLGKVEDIEWRIADSVRRMIFATDRPLVN